MDRTSSTSDTPLRVNLFTRLQRALHPPSRQNARQLVVLADGLLTITTLMVAAFHEDWKIRLAPSPGNAIALLQKASSVALVYDWDSQRGDWRVLCRACVRYGVTFHLVATMPSDDLFLAVAAAGGSSVSWKPLSPEQMITALASGRILGENGDGRSARCRA